MRSVMTENIYEMCVMTNHDSSHQAKLANQSTAEILVFFEMDTQSGSIEF